MVDAISAGARTPGQLSDIEEIPVETVAGERPSSAVGDRLLIGLAALALLGGALIAAGNFISGLLPEVAAQASPTQGVEETAEPSRTPRPTRSPRPLREVSVVPGDPPAPPQYAGSTTVWLEVEEATPLRSDPFIGAVEVGTLEPGQVAIGDRPDADHDWAFVYEPQPGGWVRLLDGEGVQLVTFESRRNPTFGGHITAVATGPAGFVAHGVIPSSGYQPEESVMAFAADGVSWQSVQPLHSSPWGGASMAWGPSGWLAATAVESTTGGMRTWLFESADGQRWTSIGSLGAEEEYVRQLLATDAGYLLVGDSGGSDDTNLWFSLDGLTWQEGVDPFSAVRDVAVQVIATPTQFVAWALTESDSGDPLVATSTNGRNWTAVPVDGDVSALLQLAVADGDSLLGFARSDSGRLAAYRGSLRSGQVALSRDPSLELAFEGASVSALASDGATAIALGFEKDGGASLAWRSTGSGWRRLPVPDGGFGGVVRQAVTGQHGTVVVGAEYGAFGVSPVLWHLGAGDEWVREARPVVPAPPEPTPEECGEPPDNALEFMVLDATLGASCFGDAPITFTAWSLECPGCYAPNGGSGEPAWLMDPEHTLFLLPMEASDSGWWKMAVLHPDLAWREELVGAWLRITGHYDDPAAADCRRNPPPDEEPYYGGPEDTRWVCRQAFVVTELDIVERG